MRTPIANIPATDRDQVVLILDDDATVTEALALALERGDRTLITCNDLESAQLAVERLKPSVIVSDVRLSGDFSYEGLEFITFAKRHAPDARVILMTGDAPDKLQFEAAHRGAVSFLQKPFNVSDLEAVVDLMSPVDRMQAPMPPLIRMPLLDEILEGDSLNTAFQPIVQLGGSLSWEPIGYEALARFRSDTPLRNPEVLFDYAAKKGRVADLETACLRKSLRAGGRIGREGLLFLNVHPDVMSLDRTLFDVLASEASAVGVPLSNIVLELTEQGAIEDHPKVYRVFDELRAEGVRFAFDDVGLGYSHLRLIDRIRPEFLKISQRFGTGFECDSMRRKMVSALVGMARQFDCSVILEGIEDFTTAEAASAAGITYGQGYLFGRPSDASAFAH